MKKFISSLKMYLPALAIFIAATGISAASASVWSNPPSSPPDNNTETPINVGATTQLKTGNFTGNVIGANGFCLPFKVINGVASTTDPRGGCISEWPVLGSSQTTTVINNNSAACSHIVPLTGSGSWTVPADVTNICVTIVGAGGGGGGSKGSLSGSQPDYYQSGGAGGSSGAEIDAQITVVPGMSIPYSVGAGGVASALGYGKAGGNGVASVFDGLTAGAGAGGLNTTPAAVGTAASGQVASQGVATYVSYPGQPGDIGQTAAAGGTNRRTGKGGAGYKTGGNAQQGGGPKVTVNNAGTGWGAGGGGATYVVGTASGGKGSDGTIIVSY